MFVLAVFSWWYGAGWARLAKRVMQRTDNVLAFFSVGTLAKTLFAPFRQISAGQVQGSMDVQMRAFFDRLISRIVGAVVRSFMIIAGLFSALFAVLLGLLQMLAWPLVPLLPLAGLVAWMTGWAL